MFREELGLMRREPDQSAGVLSGHTRTWESGIAGVDETEGGKKISTASWFNNKTSRKSQVSFENNCC